MPSEMNDADSLSSSDKIEHYIWTSPYGLQPGLRGDRANILSNIPSVVRKRVNALKKLLVTQTDIDSKFYTELHALECKYHKVHLEFYNKRSEIVQGIYEPTDEECDFPSNEDENYAIKDLYADIDDKAKVEDLKSVEIKDDSDIKGIPDFWLTILKNTSFISDMIQPHDEPILSHLKEIKVFLLEEPMGFALEFHFSPNEWFTNSVLTKVYEMKCVPDKSNPLGFEGPKIFKCKGCKILWNEGKNITIKLVKKKQKHNVKGSVRFVNKSVKNVSFFHFFSPPAVLEQPETEVYEEVDNLLTIDFEIGHYIRERIIPRAVLYYTGEALLDENYFDVDEVEEEEDE